LSTDFRKKRSNIKFHQNLFSGNEVVKFELMDKRTDRQTDTTKLIVAFRSFANSPKESL